MDFDAENYVESEVLSLRQYSNCNTHIDHYLKKKGESNNKMFSVNMGKQEKNFL